MSYPSLASLKLFDIRSVDEARNIAIDWSHCVGDPDEEGFGISLGELIEWQAFFTDLADRFDLYDEFRENGII